MRRLLVAVVLALALAGCHGLADREPTRTATPAPVPESGPESDLASGEVDPEEVAAAHESVLATENYTLTITERIVVDGRTRRNVTRTRRVARGARAYAISREERTRDFSGSAPGGTIGYWYNGTVELARFENGSGREYAAFESSATGPLLDPPDRRTVAALLAAFDVTVADRTETTSGTVYRVRSRRLVEPERMTTPSFVGVPRDGRFEARIGERGIVYEYRVAYTASAVGVDGPVRVVRRARVKDVGTTAVEPPDWVPNASG